MQKTIFLRAQSPVSRRFAVLDDDGRVAYLYLTEPGEERPCRDAVVYSRQAPVESVNWEAIGASGDPPPLTVAVASADAVIPYPRQEEFTFRWSADGESVAVLRNGVPLALIQAAERLGYSRALARPSPLANPWDDSLYRRLF